MKSFIATRDMEINGESYKKDSTVLVTDGLFGILNDKHDIDPGTVRNVSKKDVIKANDKADALKAEIELLKSIIADMVDTPKGKKSDSLVKYEKDK